MQVPIPDDWDGEKWTCVQVRWPNSPQWMAILNGLLTDPTRGRYWDARTGSILDAQGVIWEAFGQNYPWVSCVGQPPPGVPPPEMQGGNAGLDEDGSEDDMPAVTWVTIESGILFMHFGPCCKIAVGPTSVQGTSGGAGTDPPDPDDPWACNKARGMADNWAAVVIAGVNELMITDPGVVVPAAPYQQAWLNELPSFAWDQDALWLAMVWYSQAGNDEIIEADVNGDDFANWLTCLWAPVVLNTSGLVATEFDAMSAAISGFFGVVTTTFLRYLLSATRFSTFSWWAQSYFNETADCTCPEVPAEPSKWLFTGFTDYNDDGGQIQDATVLNGGRRILLDIQYDDGGTYRGISSVVLGVSGQELDDTVGIRVYPQAGKTFVPSAEWKGYVYPAPPVDWHHVSTGGIIYTEMTRDHASGYVDFTSPEISEVDNIIECHSMREYPDNPAPDPGLNWFVVVEIIMNNGDYYTPIGPGA